MHVRDSAAAEDNCSDQLEEHLSACRRKRKHLRRQRVAFRGEAALLVLCRHTLPHSGQAERCRAESVEQALLGAVCLTSH